MYLRGQPPPSVNMYWRRFAIQDIPLDTADNFDVWLRERWYEKDALMEGYLKTGFFPGIASEPNNVTDGDTKENHIETEVRLRNWWEVGNIFVVLAAVGLVLNLVSKAWGLAINGKK